MYTDSEYVYTLSPSIVIDDYHCRKFETLSGLMSEEHNWKAYSTHLEDILDKNTPCVPFLGVLLTMIVQYESVHAMHESTSRFRRPSRSSRVKKVSGVEDYTVLEAITVRNRCVCVCL